MEMRQFSYSTFTKKQAGIIYAAVKRGELSATKATISKMYDLVGANMLDACGRELRGSFERCVGHIVEGRMELAQAELDGKRTRLERFVERVEKRIATDEDWFHEPGEEIEEEVWGERWVVA